VTIVVNGRFLRAKPVGLHRAARSMLDAAKEAGLPTEVLAPPGVTDPRVDRHVWGPPGRFGDHAWEQMSLPAAARSRRVLSLTQTAPLLARHSVVMVHDIAPIVGPQWFVPSMRAYGRLVMAGARRADLVLTVSDTAAGELAGQGIGTDRLAVVKPAIDPSFQPSDATAVAAAKATHGLARPYLLMAGWSDPRKDLATAVAAHRIARRREPHDLVLVGRPHVTFRPVEVPDDPSVRRLGYVSDDELRALLTGASALVYPSRYEGFGLPPLEAWACGTPALVADIPVLRETTGGAGELLPVGDAEAWAEAICRAVRGEVTAPPPLARTWGDAGRELAEILG
jgi:glycosyltransferase involved in cell wall biosynthesis